MTGDHALLPRGIDLVKHMHQRYGKVDIMVDNAGALTGRDMRECLDDTGEDVESS